MLAKEIMTRNVITAEPGTDVDEIARRLVENRISAMPVVDSRGKLVGIVSEGDLLRRPEIGTEKHPSRWAALLLGPAERAAHYVKSHGRHAKDVMTRQVITVGEDTELADIAELLERHRIKRVPVLAAGKVVGIVSRANLLHALATIKPSRVADASDETIRAQVLTTLGEEAGVDMASVNVIVTNGVVHLWGAVGSESERQAAAVSAENAPGVRGIENHLGVLPSAVRNVGL
jgi:CBS domain-containing protein